MNEEERLRRWRLVLGQHGGENMAAGGLSKHDVAVDRALEALYDNDRKGGLGASAPSVPKWLGDIRQYFPTPVVQILQKDALERLNLKQLLLEPEILESVEPDVNLVSTLMGMRGLLTGKTKETARLVVQKVVDDLMRRLEDPMRQAVTGALDRSSRNRRPRHSEIDWHRTIRANLRHYQTDLQTIIPEVRLGYGRRHRQNVKDITLCIDQSGSMAASVVYSSIFGAVMASLPAVKTRLVVFDTNVVDLTEELEDPVDVLFSVQLGGGTDINRAVGYCESQIERPEDSILVLISDLYEGGVADGLVARVKRLLAKGVQVIVLLALSDEGAPSYDKALAQRLADIGAPSFACTPDLFPELMASALKKEDIALWASKVGLHHT